MFATRVVRYREAISPLASLVGGVRMDGNELRRSSVNTFFRIRVRFLRHLATIHEVRLMSTTITRPKNQVNHVAREAMVS